MVLEISEKEQLLLVQSICMSAREGGYIYPKETTDDEISSLLDKLGAKDEIVESAGEYGWSRSEKIWMKKL